MPSPRSGRAVLRALLVVLAIVTSLLAFSPAHAATGAIAGKVTKPSGNGLADSVVDLYEVDDDGYWYVDSVKTRSDGTYTFGSLPRGSYAVGFAAESKKYAAEFWNNKALIQDSAPISVGTSKVSGINAKLAVGGIVIGRVLAGSPTSHPVAGAEVAAYRYDDGEWTFGKSVLTSSDGWYTLGGLSDGRWTLEFNPPFDGPDADLALQYWRENRTFEDDDTFVVRPGMTVEDKQAHLEPGGRISGKVTGPNGEPVVDALVFGYPADSEKEVGNVAFTDANGNYTMTGLSPGQHRLEFVDGLEFDPFGEGPDYASEWWDNQASFRGADPVTVTAGETTAGKNAQLARSSEPLVNVTRPTVVGEPRVGEVQTADPGTWTPNVHESGFTYQWLVDGAEIPGATERTYTPYGGLVGRQIYVEVTATRGDGQSVTLASNPTAPLAVGLFRNIRKPYLTGDLRVGSVVSFHEGEWSSAPDRVYHQLLADGRFVVDGSGGMQHLLTPDLLGKKLTLRTTVIKGGFDSTTATGDETAPVGLGEFDPPTTASISGAAIVGEPLETTLVDTVAGATYQYQWLADGTEITGADQPAYTPTSDDVGKSLSVRLAMTKPGYDPAQSTSASTDPVVEAGTLPITQGSEAPSISGTPKVGSTLTADAGDWKPAPSSFAYQWLADGVEIDGATGGTFKPTATEGGKRISVKVTASRSGYASGTATSAETAQVVTSTPFGAPQGLEATKSTVTYIDLAWTKVDNAAKYRIYYGIGSGTRTKLEVGDVTSARLTNLKPDTTYSIDIAALKSNGTRSPYSPRINVRTKPLVPPTNFAVTGQTRTSLTFSWTKVAGVPKYRIWYGIGSGTRTKVELGNVSTATITGLKPGTTYSVDIASRLSDGTKSAYTPRIDATTAD